MSKGHNDSLYARNRQEQKIIDTLNLFNKVLSLVGDYEHEVKKLHYHNDKKIEYFDKIREVLYGYYNKKYGSEN